MKHAASVLVASILVVAFCPENGNAGQQAPNKSVTDSAPPDSVGGAVATEDSTDRNETPIDRGEGQPAGQWAREMGVIVMTRSGTGYLEARQGVARARGLRVGRRRGNSNR